MSYNPMTARFLEVRGYTPEYLADIEDASHADLMDVDVLCERLVGFRSRGERVVILPDFDMDGIAAGTLGYAGLVELGFDAALFRPDPSEGYGFSAAAVDRLVAEFPDARCILTCDVGITCYEGVERARELGLSVLVTDHHTQEEGHALAADVVVDPCRVDETYSVRGICGAHVLWQVLDRLCARYFPQARENIDLLRVFAGIGTVSDMMPLVHENRPLVRDAVAICRLIWADGRSTAWLGSVAATPVLQSSLWGVRAMLDCFASAGKIARSEDIDESFFGYYLAPAFNAAKRMGAAMDDVFGVFFSDERYELASSLYSLNEMRKKAVADAYDDMMSRTQPYAPHIYLSDAGAGLLGLLATRVVRDTAEPCLVLAQEKGKSSWHGSGRSPEWYPALDRIGGEGFFIAGHQGAFGVGVTDNRELKALSAFLSRDVAEQRPEGLSPEVVPDLTIGLRTSCDFDVDCAMLSEFLDDMDRLRPFGRGFEAPVVECRFPAGAAAVRTMGSAKQHLKLSLLCGLDVLCWNQAGVADEIAASPAAVVSVIGKLERAEDVEVRPGETWYQAKEASRYDPSRIRRTVQLIGDVSVK